MIRAIALSLALLTAAAPLTAQAQDSTALSAQTAHTPPAEAARIGKALEHDLAARGAQLAIVFRAGRPHQQMPPGMGYTHGAFWIYRTIHTADGRSINGYAVYNLYAGDGHSLAENRSQLVQDYPTNFVMGAAEPQLAVIVPTPEMQRRLIALVDSPSYEALHNPSYSLIDNPFDARHQSCTTFILDIVAAAAWEVTDPRQIQSDLQAHFTPTIVRTDPLTRIFGPMFSSRIPTDDQHGPIRTAAYESIAAFMQANGLASAAYLFQAPPAAP
jgi:hypothetical protein